LGLSATVAYYTLFRMCIVKHTKLPADLVP